MCMLKPSFDLSKIELSLQDGPKFMAEEAKLFNYPFPYLYDEVCKCQFPLALCLNFFFPFLIFGFKWVSQMSLVLYVYSFIILSLGFGQTSIL